MIRKSKFLMLCAVLAVLALDWAVATAKPKWQVLFDGKSTASWRAFRRSDFPSKCWTIENGSLRTNAGCPEADRVDIVTKDKYQDFELELQWRVAPGANSGVIYLVSEDEDATWKTGPEMQVLDDAKHADGKNNKTSAGSLYALIAPTNKTLRPVGQYNKASVRVKNNHVEYWLNGKKVVAYELGSAELKSLIAQSKFKEFPRFAMNREGYVALQFHGDNVWYRKVRIRALAVK